MSRKTSLETVESGASWLRPYVHKYLYFMAFIQTASPLTVRSYQNDLSQAFGLPKEDFSNGSSPPADREKLPSLPTSDLLRHCRAAQTRWSKLAASSRNRKAACLKSFLNWLHGEGLVDQDLAHQIHAPKVPTRLPHYLSVDEALALLKRLKDEELAANTEVEARRSMVQSALILLLYGGGLRVSEACSLRWDSVDLGGKLARVAGKGGKERLVALPQLSIDALASLTRLGPYVFGEEPLGTRNAYDIVKAAGLRTGLLKPLHPHALRHSFATHLLSSGANLRTLQELLGHQTLQATQRYTHVGIDQLARTVQEFHPLGDDQDATPTKRLASRKR